MNESKIDMAEMHRENRQLRNALETLLEELDGDGQPDTAKVRERMPDDPGKKNPIEPPWEREGYESKSEWLSNK